MDSHGYGSENDSKHREREKELQRKQGEGIATNEGSIKKPPMSCNYIMIFI